MLLVRIISYIKRVEKAIEIVRGKNMITIVRGMDRITVTNSAYENVFKGQGYLPVNEKFQNDRSEPKVSEPIETIKEDKKTTEVKSGPSEDDIFFDEMTDKPIGEWTTDEVKRFAAMNDIDIKGTKNVGEAKEKVQTWLDDHAEEIIERK